MLGSWTAPMSEIQKPTLAPKEIEKLKGRLSAAKAEADECREEVAAKEKRMEELKGSLVKLPESSPDRQQLERELAEIEDDLLPEARLALEEAEKASSEALECLQGAGRPPQADAVGSQAKAAPAASPPPLKVPKAGARVRTRWMLNGVGPLSSTAIVKRVHNAEKGLLDLTIEHGGRLINLEAVPHSGREDQYPCWLQ